VPVDPLENAVETFSAPIEHLIVALGQGIADAQRVLDQNSIKSQDAIDSDPSLSSYGLQATWYQFPRVDLELKLAITIAQQSNTPSGAPSAQASAVLAPVLNPIRLVAQPVSASYQTHFSYDAQAASVLTLSIVPVPSPRAGDQSVVVPSMKQNDVQLAALTSNAQDASGHTIKFQTVKDANGTAIPDPTLRFDVHFNAAARLWYVLQYDPANTARTPAVVTVDDATRAVRVISTP
jgi:hypothetical protein